MPALLYGKWRTALVMEDFLGQKVHITSPVWPAGKVIAVCLLDWDESHDRPGVASILTMKYKDDSAMSPQVIIAVEIAEVSN